MNGQNNSRANDNSLISKETKPQNMYKLCGITRISPYNMQTMRVVRKVVAPSFESAKKEFYVKTGVRATFCGLLFDVDTISVDAVLNASNNEQ